MKIKLLFSSLIVVAALWSGCREKAPVIPELVVGDRKVLVEELTGISCTNCPDGAEELRVLGEKLGENLIVVSIHSASGYDEPLGVSKYDFRTEDGDAVADYISDNNEPGAPAASIDRSAITEQVGPNTTVTSIFVNKPWSGLVNPRAGVDPGLGLFIAKTYNPNERKLEITLNVSPDIPQNGETRLSVYITEDSIIDVQDSKTMGLIYNYVHQHVFRDAVSAPTGDNISAALQEGLPFTRTYTTILKDNWIPEHCHIVAFVHKHGDIFEKEVLQADEIHIID